jgi:hypothetical protein
LRRNLCGLGNLACFDAAGTHVDFSDTAFFYKGPDPLEIGVESSFVQIVGVADIIADHGFFSANSTLF